MNMWQKRMRDLTAKRVATKKILKQLKWHGCRVIKLKPQDVPR